MLKVFLAIAVLLCVGNTSGETFQGISTQGGLSGFPFLAGSDVLQTGLLRIQGQIDYVDIRNSSDSYLILPLAVTWGLSDKLEIGGEIPLYLDDSSGEGQLLGDVTAGAAWFYETARGGSSLVLRGQLRMPTGMAGRDRGSELDIGASTGTTFRLFRLQAAASYVLYGGRDPFEGDINDYMKFSMGGASYISESVQIVCAMDGNTLGDLGLSGSGIFSTLNSISLFGTVRVGLDGGESSLLSGGICWTGSGF